MIDALKRNACLLADDRASELLVSAKGVEEDPSET